MEITKFDFALSSGTKQRCELGHAVAHLGLIPYWYLPHQSVELCEALPSALYDVKAPDYMLLFFQP